MYFEIITAIKVFRGELRGCFVLIKWVVMLEHWLQGLQIGFPNSMVSLFNPGANTRP
jgi:hypothetical protein